MAKRITPEDLFDTEKLVEEILVVVLRERERVAFLVKAGEAHNTCARIRTFISRTRRKMQSRGKRPKHFRLNSHWHPETHDGIRYDCIIMWHEVHAQNIMREELEDLMADG